jgi:hypothetical protein
MRAFSFGAAVAAVVSVLACAGQAEAGCLQLTTTPSGGPGLQNNCNQTITFEYCSRDNGLTSCGGRNYGADNVAPGNLSYLSGTNGGEVVWLECVYPHLPNLRMRRCQ